jgi:HlyD family secretion protein
MKTAVAAATAAKAQYEQAVAGARVEDKAAANALVIQARGANAEVDAYLDETKIRAPISGEVSLKLAEEGEIIGAGMPSLQSPI